MNILRNKSKILSTQSQPSWIRLQK
jgi:hypothetical protein